MALDEAHRYVRTFTRGDDNTEMGKLTKNFVDAVRTTRKYGLGYMFITQTIASLHREIVGQLRLTAFGYGLTTGSEITQVQEFVTDGDALSLYKSFVDPQSRREYPFMFTGTRLAAVVHGRTAVRADVYQVRGVLRRESVGERLGHLSGFHEWRTSPARAGLYTTREAFEAAKKADFD